MRKFKSSKKSINKKVKYTINTKSNVIFEDIHQHSNFKTKFKLISDPKEPFYKYKWQEEKE